MKEAKMAYTRADVEIEYFDTPWGGKAARVTVTRPESFYSGHTYSLRSAKGLEHATKKGGGWNYLVDRERVRGEDPGDFLGSLDTDDLETAIDWLIGDFSKWDNDQNDRAKIAQSLAQLREILGEMDEWDPIRTDATLRSRWPEARQLFLNVEMGLFEPPVPATAPAPPEWPWHGRVALLDTPSEDGRVMRSSGDYFLRPNGCALMGRSEGHRSGDLLGHIHRLRPDRREGVQAALWAYGTTPDPDIARQLNSGQLFASIGLVEDAAYELGETYWQGGMVSYAIALPAGMHPWKLGS